MTRDHPDVTIVVFVPQLSADLCQGSGLVLFHKRQHGIDGFGRRTSYTLFPRAILRHVMLDRADHQPRIFAISAAPFPLDTGREYPGKLLLLLFLKSRTTTWSSVFAVKDLAESSHPKPAVVS
jgi:hypothetical protein